MTLVAMIFIVLLLGAINALFSYFLDYCFWEGSIFGRWLPFSAKINLWLFKGKKLKEINLLKDHKEYQNMLIDAAQMMPFYKISGGCLICTNIWISMISFCVLKLCFLPFSFWFFIPYALFSSFVLRKIAKD